MLRLFLEESFRWGTYTSGKWASENWGVYKKVFKAATHLETASWMKLRSGSSVVAFLVSTNEAIKVSEVAQGLL